MLCRPSRLAVVLGFALIPTAWIATTPAPAQQEAPGAARKVKKTDAEWRKVLTREQYLVTRQKATEPAFTGKYWNNHARGEFDCVCCGAPLFSSRTKFDSGTGWPSFFEPIDMKRVDRAIDNLQAEPRVEVMCRDCGAHLGHVFDDGPPPTGLRYCINSASLKFLPAAASTTSRTKAKAKAKAKGKTPPKDDTTPADEPAAKDATPPAESNAKAADEKPAR